MLGQRAARRHVRPQLRHHQRRPGAPLRRWLPADPASPGQELGDIVALHAPVTGSSSATTECGSTPTAAPSSPARSIVAAPPPLVLDIDWFPRLPHRRHAAAARARHGPADEVRRGLPHAVLARGRSQRLRHQRRAAPPAPSSTTRPRTAGPASCSRSSAAPPGARTDR